MMIATHHTFTETINKQLICQELCVLFTPSLVYLPQTIRGRNHSLLWSFLKQHDSVYSMPWIDTGRRTWTCRFTTYTVGNGVSVFSILRVVYQLCTTDIQPKSYCVTTLSHFMGLSRGFSCKPKQVCVAFHYEPTTCCHATNWFQQSTSIQPT